MQESIFRGTDDDAGLFFVKINVHSDSCEFYFESTNSHSVDTIDCILIHTCRSEGKTNN